MRTMLSALQTQLTSGPLADLNAGNVDGNGFIIETQSMIAFNDSVDQQLLRISRISTTCSSSKGSRFWPT